jgi:UDP-3-O-acyl-N-acetylglucosamine deacetylase
MVKCTCKAVPLYDGSSCVFFFEIESLSYYEKRISSANLVNRKGRALNREGSRFNGGGV